MAFFEAHSRRRGQPRRPLPHWTGPPGNVLGRTVAIDLVIARSADAVISVSAASVYPTGFAFELDARVRARSLRTPFHGGAAFTDDPSEHAALPEDLFRYGIEFSDGSRATSLDPIPDLAERPRPPVLIRQGGWGTDAHWTNVDWVWPLPPPGELRFVCEWPAASIALSATPIDAAIILDAAQRAAGRLWEAEGRGVGEHWVGSVLTR